MSRPPYPHRLVQTSLREVLDWHGACRCGEPVTAKHRWQVPAEWGAGCPIALREALAETEARAERAEAERDATVDEARRFRDLVRHQRGPLYDAELITDEEYAALASDAGAVARLRGYDELRRDSLADADKAVAAALEARAKELDDYARDYFPGVEHPSVLSFRNGVHKAASIVRGGR